MLEDCTSDDEGVPDVFPATQPSQPREGIVLKGVQQRSAKHSRASVGVADEENAERAWRCSRTSCRAPELSAGTVYSSGTLPRSIACRKAKCIGASASLESRVARISWTDLASASPSSGAAKLAHLILTLVDRQSIGVGAVVSGQSLSCRPKRRTSRSNDLRLVQWHWR